MDSKASLTFTWKDQGWGDEKGWLKVLLINATTSDIIASTPIYHAHHDFETVNEVFDINHDLVRYRKAG